MLGYLGVSWGNQTDPNSTVICYPRPRWRCLLPCTVNTYVGIYISVYRCCLNPVKRTRAGALRRHTLQMP